MVIFAFACLGFLIGNLIGLSAESTLSVVLPLLFAFGSGSAVAFLHKLNINDRKLAASAVAALSISCLIGTYTGVIVSEYQLLTPHKDIKENSSAIVDRKYLRSFDINYVETIDQSYKSGVYTVEEAYEEIYKHLSESNNPWEFILFSY